MKTLLKKYILFIAFCIALAESFILFSFCSINSAKSILFMMVSYAILLFFPAGIFIASLKEHRTETSLTSLANTGEDTQRQKDLEQFSNTKLQFYKKSFACKLKMLYALLEKNDLAAAQKLLGEPVISKNAVCICPTNAIVDGILREKATKCEKHGILFEYSILFPEETTLSFSTLISLFSNLLDNAIESCIASCAIQPTIRLTIDYKGDFLVIFMQNTKADFLSFDSAKKESTKQDSLSHGFGLSIIEDIAKLHDGFCEWTDNGNSFESEVMLRHIS